MFFTRFETLIKAKEFIKTQSLVFEGFKSNWSKWKGCISMYLARIKVSILLFIKCTIKISFYSTTHIIIAIYLPLLHSYFSFLI